MSVTGSYSEALRKARYRLPWHLRLFTDQTGRQMVDETKKRTPVVTGEHRESIKKIDVTRRITGTGVQVWRSGARSNLRTMSFLEDDTAPHIIRAKTKKGLVFFSGYAHRTVERQYVMHPGTTGMHMFAKAAAVTDSRLGLRFNSALNRWLRESGLR